MSMHSLPVEDLFDTLLVRYDYYDYMYMHVLISTGTCAGILMILSRCGSTIYCRSTSQVPSQQSLVSKFDLAKQINGKNNIRRLAILPKSYTPIPPQQLSQLAKKMSYASGKHVTDACYRYRSLPPW